MKKTVTCNPEFGCELVCVIPYINYLHKNKMLEKLYTVKDMKPFYFFLEDNMIEEVFDTRTVDNNISLKDVPNNWIHHNSKAITGKEYSELTLEEQKEVNGVLDYTEWIPPDYVSKYKDLVKPFTDKPYVVIFNKYTLEHGNIPIGYFDMIMLQQIIEYLTGLGYAIVYRRPDNNNYAQDQNEYESSNSNLFNTYGIKAYDQDDNMVTDKQLLTYYEDCFLLEDLFDKSEISSKNEFELSLYSNAQGFITVNGGNCVLASIFGKPIVVYVCEGKELRENYFNSNCYFKRFANSEIFPIFNPINTIKLSGRNYNGVINTVKKVFK